MFKRFVVLLVVLFALPTICSITTLAQDNQPAGSFIFTKYEERIGINIIVDIVSFDFVASVEVQGDEIFHSGNCLEYDANLTTCVMNFSEQVSFSAYILEVMEAQFYVTCPSEIEYTPLAGCGSGDDESHEAETASDECINYSDIPVTGKAVAEDDEDGQCFYIDNPGSDHQGRTALVIYLDETETENPGWVIRMYDSDGNPTGDSYGYGNSLGSPMNFTISGTNGTITMFQLN